MTAVLFITFIEWYITHTHTLSTRLLIWSNAWDSPNMLLLWGLKESRVHCWLSWLIECSRKTWRLPLIITGSKSWILSKAELMPSLFWLKAIAGTLTRWSSSWALYTVWLSLRFWHYENTFSKASPNVKHITKSSAILHHRLLYANSSYITLFYLMYSFRKIIKIHSLTMKGNYFAREQTTTSWKNGC